MGASNQRLRLSGAPALLQQFTLNLTFSGAFGVAPGDATLLFSQVARPNAQMQALARSASGGNVTIGATFIAAPALTSSGLMPTRPKEGACDP